MGNGYQTSGYYSSAVPGGSTATGTPPRPMLPGSIAPRDEDRGATAADTADWLAKRTQVAINQQAGLHPGPGTGTNPFDPLNLGIPPSTTGPGPTGPGGGGGGAAAAAQKAAYQAAYNDYLTQSDAQYNSFDDTLRKLWDPGIVNQRYDAAQGGIADATRVGRDRVNAAYNNQVGRNRQATGDIASAFRQGDRALQDVRARFQANDAAVNNRLNSSLGAFGSGQLAGEESGRLDEMFAAGQMANQQQATTWAASQAMNPEIYGATAQSALTGMSQEEAALMRTIAAQRATDLRQNDVTLATSLNQNSRSKLDTNLAVQQAMAEMGLSSTGRLDPVSGLPTNLTEAQKAYLRSVDPAKQGGA